MHSRNIKNSIPCYSEVSQKTVYVNAQCYGPVLSYELHYDMCHSTMKSSLRSQKHLRSLTCVECISGLRLSIKEAVENKQQGKVMHDSRNALFQRDGCF